MVCYGLDSSPEGGSRIAVNLTLSSSFQSVSTECKSMLHPKAEKGPSNQKLMHVDFP